MLSRWTVSTLGEVAELFNVTVDTVRHWRTESPPMPGSYRSWPIKEIIQWRENKLKSTDIKSKKLQQEIELGQIRIDREKLELAEKRRELVPIHDVERVFAQAMVEIREELMELPQAIATSVPPQIKTLANEEAEQRVRGCLLSLGRRLDLMQFSTETESNG